MTRKRYDVMYDNSAVFSSDDLQEAVKYYKEEVLTRYNRPQTGIIDREKTGYNWIA